MMRNVFVSCCAAAAMLSAASLLTPTPAQAWWRQGYVAAPSRAYAYRPNYRPRVYARRPSYFALGVRPRPYRAYAYAPGPRIWVGGRRRWR
jgi:hypothetical protein